VTVAHCERLSRLNEAARTLRVFFDIHLGFPQPAASPRFAVSQSPGPV
jgi:hypothetical protein